MLIVAGLISSFTSTLFLRYVSESRKYFDPIIKILYALTMISLLLISIIIPIGDYLPILIIGLIVLGLGCLGLQPFECEALEEISFPVQESISVNGMFFVACSFGFALSFISTLDGNIVYFLIKHIIFSVLNSFWKLWFMGLKHKHVSFHNICSWVL